MSIPRSALKLLPSINDQLLLLDLLSRSKRPRTKMEWELMAQCFIDDAVSGQTLYDFYAILVESGCVDDGDFGGKWQSEREGVVHLDIDCASNRYQRARSKFVDKVAAFNEGLESEYKMDGIGNVDLFLLYILVTKRGGFERISRDDAVWRRIVEEMPALFDPHLAVRRVHSLRSLYRTHLGRFEALYFEADGFDAVIASESDHFGIALYLEECPLILDVLCKYPMKRTVPSRPALHRSYWLEMAPNGKRLNGTIFGNAADCHSASAPKWQSIQKGLRHEGRFGAKAVDDGDGGSERVDVGSVLQSMVTSTRSVVDIDGDGRGGGLSRRRSESVGRRVAQCGLKGLHPFTRRLIASMLREIE